MSNATPPSKTVSPISPERLDWNLLRTFMFVVQERGISRAATALHLSQPAVSQALKRLEDAVGGTLLYRRNGEFRLTGLGEALYGIARDMYGMVARIDEAASHDEGEIAGTLRLMLMSKIQSAAYDEFLMQFHRRYPKIEFYVDVMQSAFILDALSKRIPALGICLCRKAIDSLERRIFMRHRYVMVCGRNHPLFSRRNIQVEDLLDQNFVSFASDQLGDTLSPLTIFRDQQGFTGRIVGTSPYVEEIRRMVIAGMGLSCLPEHMIRQDMLAGDLKRVLADDVMAEIDVFLTWHKQRKLSLVEQTFLSAFERFLERTPIEIRAG